MFKDVELKEMQGMFSSAQVQRFSAVSSPDGFFLVFQGCALLTFRNQRRCFRSFDSVLQFVKRHFVDPYRSSTFVETVVLFDEKA